jgi:hypothetical protein
VSENELVWRPVPFLTEEGRKERRRQDEANLRAFQVEFLPTEEFLSTPQDLKDFCYRINKALADNQTHLNVIESGPVLVQLLWRGMRQQGRGIVPERIEIPVIDRTRLAIAAARGETSYETPLTKAINLVLHWCEEQILRAPEVDGQYGDKDPKGTKKKAVQPEEPLRQLEPADRRAYLSFCLAEGKKGKRLEDRKAYEFLKEEVIFDDKGDLGELADYKLPAFDTWSRQLRNARNSLDEQKYTRRNKRATGKSIVKGDQIEFQSNDEAS